MEKGAKRLTPVMMIKIENIEIILAKMLEEGSSKSNQIGFLICHIHDVSTGIPASICIEIRSCSVGTLIRGFWIL